MDSALGNRLHREIDLSDMERDVLDRLERVRRKFSAGDEFLSEGGQSEHFLILRSGWAHASMKLPDGARQILRLHFPGDLMGGSNVAWARSAATLTAATDVEVAAFPRGELGRVFVEHPRLAAMLYALTSAEAVALSDRLTSIGRMSAISRLSALLLDILSRRRATGESPSESFEMPLTQADLGDLLGLTKVHVNRTLRELEARGLIARTGRRMTLANIPGLVKLCGFVDRRADVATDWLPSTPARPDARQAG